MAFKLQLICLFGLAVSPRPTSFSPFEVDMKRETSSTILFREAQVQSRDDIDERFVGRHVDELDLTLEEGTLFRNYGDVSLSS